MTGLGSSLRELVEDLLSRLCKSSAEGDGEEFKSERLF